MLYLQIVIGMSYGEIIQNGVQIYKNFIVIGSSLALIFRNYQILSVPDKFM